MGTEQFFTWQGDLASLSSHLQATLACTHPLVVEQCGQTQFRRDAWFRDGDGVRFYLRLMEKVCESSSRSAYGETSPLFFESTGLTNGWRAWRLPCRTTSMHEEGLKALQGAANVLEAVAAFGSRLAAWVRRASRTSREGITTPLARLRENAETGVFDADLLDQFLRADALGAVATEVSVFPVQIAAPSLSDVYAVGGHDGQVERVAAVVDPSGQWSSEHEFLGVLIAELAELAVRGRTLGMASAKVFDVAESVLERTGMGPEEQMRLVWPWICYRWIEHGMQFARTVPLVATDVLIKDVSRMADVMRSKWNFAA